jgi:hypothetical protein
VTDSARPARARPTGGLCAALALLLFVGCGGSGDNGHAAQPSTTVPPSAQVSPSAAETPQAPLPAPVAIAQQRAAADAGVSIEEVSVLRYDRVEFPSAALGCPASGKGYAQVITPGYSVQLRVIDHEVEYHTNLEQTVVRCLSNSP